MNDNELYPVPVLVDNIKVNGDNVNQKSDRSKWKLTRRFFLVDNLSGRNDLTKDPVVIQYASSVEILYRLRGDGQIYPPLLKIKYVAVAVSSNVDVTVTFRAAYEMDTSKIKRNIEVNISLCSNPVSLNPLVFGYSL